MTDDYSGPAFPIEGGNEPGKMDASSGMSLRDYFAGQALAGLLVNESSSFANPNENPPHTLARKAYVVADAMIVERQLPTNKAGGKR